MKVTNYTLANSLFAFLRANGFSTHKVACAVVACLGQYESVNGDVKVGKARINKKGFTLSVGQAGKIIVPAPANGEALPIPLQFAAFSGALQGAEKADAFELNAIPEKYVEWMNRFALPSTEELAAKAAQAAAEEAAALEPANVAPVAPVAA